MKSFLKALFTSAYIEFVSTGDKKKMNHQRFYHAVRDKMVEKTTQMDVNMEWNHFIMMIFVSAMAFHQLFWLHWYKYTSQTQINNKQLVIFLMAQAFALRHLHQPQYTLRQCFLLWFHIDIIPSNATLRNLFIQSFLKEEQYTFRCGTHYTLHCISGKIKARFQSFFFWLSYLMRRLAWQRWHTKHFSNHFVSINLRLRSGFQKQQGASENFEGRSEEGFHVKQQIGHGLDDPFFQTRTLKAEVGEEFIFFFGEGLGVYI